MKVMLTGSSGFIASQLISRLVEEEHTIVGIDQRPPAAEFGDCFAFVKGNVLDSSVLATSMKGVETVVHLAAEHADFGVPDQSYYAVNVGGTEQVLEAAASEGVRDFVFFSSVAVYGSLDQATHEGLDPRPDSPYGRSKLAAEVVVGEWARENTNRRVVIIRPTVIYGPSNYANMFRLICQIANGKYLHIGEGSNVKSTGYIDNMVDATLFLMERLCPGVQVYNYADEPHLTSREIAETLAAALHVTIPSLTIPTRLATAFTRPLDVVASVTGWDMPVTANRVAKYTRTTHHLSDKIREAGFSSRFTSAEGLRKTAEWYTTEQKRHAQAQRNPSTAPGSARKKVARSPHESLW